MCTVQDQLSQEQHGEAGGDRPEHWPEFVADLWDRDDRLPHLRVFSYSDDNAFLFDPRTGRYGFQDWYGGESDTEEGEEVGEEGAWTQELSLEPSEQLRSQSEADEGERRMSEMETEGEEDVEDSFAVVQSLEGDEVIRKSRGYSPEDDGKPNSEQPSYICMDTLIKVCMYLQWHVQYSLLGLLLLNKINVCDPLIDIALIMYHACNPHISHCLYPCLSISVDQLLEDPEYLRIAESKLKSLQRGGQNVGQVSIEDA